MFPITFATLEELVTALPAILKAAPEIINDFKNLIALIEGKKPALDPNTDAKFDATDAELLKHK